MQFPDRGISKTTTFPPSGGKWNIPPTSIFPLRILILPLIFEVRKLIFMSSFLMPDAAASSVLSMSFTSSSTTQVENTSKIQIQSLWVRNSRFSTNIFLCWCRGRFQVLQIDLLQARKVTMNSMVWKSTKKTRIYFNYHQKLTHYFNRWSETSCQSSAKCSSITDRLRIFFLFGGEPSPIIAASSAM